jgi:hypothetical protein
MGDSTRETSEILQQLWSPTNYTRADIFGSKILYLDEHSIPWILNHIDCFVGYSEGNQSIQEVRFYPYSVDRQDDEVWDKVGQALGNLQALEDLRISISSNHEDDKDSTNLNWEDDKDSTNLNWEILAHILSHIRKKVSVFLDGERLFAAEEARSFARAIRGHNNITRFEDESGMFPYEASGALYSELATLSALKWVRLSNCRLDARHLNESALAYPDSLGGTITGSFFAVRLF